MGKPVGEKSRDHQQRGQVREERRMEVRAPEKQTDLWSSQSRRGWALRGPISPKETKMTREKLLTCPRSKEPAGKGKETAFVPLSP